MERRTPRRRRLAAWGLLVLVPSLPGCLTCAMWGLDYATDEAMPTGPGAVELVRRESHDQDVVIATDGSSGVPGAPVLLLRGELGAASWWLRPVHGDDVARHLLRERDVLAPQRATVTAVRELHEQDVVRSQAELVLIGAGEDTGFVPQVEATSLSPAARAVLAESRRNAFVFAADPWLFLPVVLRRCRDGLSSARLAAGLGVSADGLAIESFVFVGQDGLPRFEPGMAVPAEANDEQLPLAERLALLASVALVLRLQCDGGERFVRLRPDRLWLRSVCEDGDAGLRHRSLWQIEPAAVASPTFSTAVAIPCQLVRTDALYRVMPDSLADLVVKVALTPLTLALDVTVLLPVTVLLGRMKDDDEGDEARGAVRRR